EARAASADRDRGGRGRGHARALERPRGLGRRRGLSRARMAVARIVYLGLGSNLGDREEHIRGAVAALDDHGIEVEAASSLYETEPVGEILDQPDFLNAAVRVRTGLEPEPLLDISKAIEVEAGRIFGGPRHGPRPIDVDLLLLGDIELE